MVVVADYFHREALFQTDRYFWFLIDQQRPGGNSNFHRFLAWWPTPAPSSIQ